MPAQKPILIVGALAPALCFPPAGGGRARLVPRMRPELRRGLIGGKEVFGFAKRRTMGAEIITCTILEGPLSGSLLATILHYCYKTFVLHGPARSRIGGHGSGYGAVV